MSFKKDKVKNTTDAAGENAAIVVAEKKVRTPMNPKKKKKIIKLAVVVIVLAVIGGGTALAKINTGNAILPVDVVKVQKGDVEQILSTSGMIESEEIKTYFAPAEGFLSKVNVEVGRAIQKDEELITYNIEELELATKRKKIEASAIEYGESASLERDTRLQENLTEATTKYDEYNAYVDHYQGIVDKIEAVYYEKNLKEAQKKELEAEKAKYQNIMATMDEDDSKAMKEDRKEIQKIDEQLAWWEKELLAYDTVTLDKQLAEAKEELAAYERLRDENKSKKESDDSLLTDSERARISLNKQSAELTKQEADKAFLNASAGLNAEFSGIVTAKKAVDGQFVEKGVELFTIASDTKVKAVLNISKYDLEKIALNQQATVNINGKDYEGEVSSINRMAQKSDGGSPVITAEVHIKNPDSGIYLGIEGRVYIHVAKATDVLLVPVEAVNADIQGEFCYVVSESGLVERRTLVTGITSDTHIEIKEGLKEGDQVIPILPDAITEGMQVAPIDAAAMAGASGEETAPIEAAEEKTEEAVDETTEEVEETAEESEEITEEAVDETTEEAEETTEEEVKETAEESEETVE